jgi:hypothetical protein
MKKFLAIYLGTTSALEKSGWNAMDEKSRKERQDAGIKAWGEWGQRVAQSGASIVDMGGPLGKTKRAAREGISDTKNSMTGYVIVEAESHEAAAKLFENHPHFTIFPGESVEIMECLPLPRQ